MIFGRNKHKHGLFKNSEEMVLIPQMTHILVSRKLSGSLE